MSKPITIASILRFICFTGKLKKPILECILITPMGANKIIITATDGVVFRAHEMMAENNLPMNGAIVNGKAFKAAVGKAKVMPYIQYGNDGICHLSIDGATIPVMVGESYPLPACPPQDGQSVSLATSDVLAVQPATDKHKTCPSLCGIAIYALGPVATCAATDGKFLLISGPNASEAGKQNESIAILPEHFVDAICSIPGESNGTLHYSQNSKYIALRGEGFSIIGRSVDASYPTFHGALNHPSRVPFPDAIDALACVIKASEGLAKGSRAVVLGEHGASPLSRFNGGKSVAHSMPSLAGKPIALNADYVESVVGLGCTSWEVSRGLIGRGPRAIALIMPINLPEGHSMAGYGGIPLRASPVAMARASS